MLRRHRSMVPAAVASLVLVPLLALVLVSLARAQPQSQQAQEGKLIFQEKCAPCHTIGGGPLVGPDLEGVATRQPRDWLLRWIAAPDKLLAEGDPTATKLLHEWNNVPMPNEGLSQAQVEAVVAYLEATTVVTTTPTAGTTGSPAAPLTPQATAPSTSVPLLVNATRGRRLFSGRVQLQQGGPPCIACHQVAGLQSFGGGTLGPDLTQAFPKYGGTAGLTGVLANIVFPTMAPVFAGHPLSAQDQADLVGFLQTQAQRQPRPPAVPPGLVAGGGALLLLALVPVLWRQRLHGVRRSLVTRARNRLERSADGHTAATGREEGEVL